MQEFLRVRPTHRNDAEAATALDEISADMNIIENMSYHELCLLYKGEMEIAKELIDLAKYGGAHIAKFQKSNLQKL